MKLWIEGVEKEQKGQGSTNETRLCEFFIIYIFFPPSLRFLPLIFGPKYIY